MILTGIIGVLLTLGIIFGIRALVHAISGHSQEDTAGEEEEELVESEETSTEIEETQISDTIVRKFYVSGSDEDNEGPVNITASFMGDCTLGKDDGLSYAKSLNAYYDDYGPDYFFRNVHSILEADDLSVINLEGTLTTGDDRADKEYSFKGDPAYAEILTDGSVEAANLSNNHVYDYGEQGRLDTIETLDNTNIANFGYNEVSLVEVKGVQIGFSGICCYGEFTLGETPDPENRLIKNMQALQDAGADIIITVFHWGIEGDSAASEDQIRMAHLAIDNGADLVIGHHPHVLQGIEKYKGKYIAYSLGNFCFGGNSNPGDKDTMILQEAFTVEPDGAVSVSQVEVIPCSVSSTDSRNDYCPTPLDGDEARRVLEKIETCSEGLSTQPEADTAQ